MKSEPDVFGIDDLREARVEMWDGVRNYQARNMLRDQMRKGDSALFYHSNTKEPGVVGIMKIARGGYPDPTQFDPQDPHYDPKSDPEAPRWYAVDVRFQRKLERTLTLPELKAEPALAELALVRRGNRLSIMPVTERQWQAILDME